VIFTGWVTALSFLALKLPGDGNGIRPELRVLRLFWDNCRKKAEATG